MVVPTCLHGETFDDWAIFQGMIGGPFFAQFLPGWISNLALLVRGEERWSPWRSSLRFTASADLCSHTGFLWTSSCSDVSSKSRRRGHRDWAGVVPERSS